MQDWVIIQFDHLSPVELRFHNTVRNVTILSCYYFAHIFQFMQQYWKKYQYCDIDLWSMSPRANAMICFRNLKIVIKLICWTMLILHELCCLFRNNKANSRQYKKYLSQVGFKIPSTWKETETSFKLSETKDYILLDDLKEICEVTRTLVF